MATKAEVRKQTLYLLGKLRLGQAAQNQDDTNMKDAYTEVFEDLKKRGIAIWPSDASIPDDIVPHVVSLMALSRSYGVSKARLERIIIRAGANGEKARREIRLLTVPAYESLDEPSDF